MSNSNDQLDPRLQAMKEQLSGVHRVICVGSGKGGVGKSLVSAGLALLLSQQGKKVGLLDLDFYGPSAHLILGIENPVPAEDRGVVPAEVLGVKLMSIAPYIGKQPSPLRGSDATQSILELLAITRWGELDVLLVDMPPGTGDEVLDVVRLLPRAEWLVVSTPSVLSVQIVRRLVLLLKEAGARIIGVLENMAGGKHQTVQELCRDQGLPFLCPIPFDPGVEKAIGSPELLLQTAFAKSLKTVVEAL